MNKLIWDGVQNPNFANKEPFFSSLNFAVPVDTARIHSVLLDSLLGWLLRPQGSVLSEGPVKDRNGQIPHRVLAIIAELSFLYDEVGQPVEFPTVGLGIIFKPPYVRYVSFSTTYFYLNQWWAKKDTGIAEERMMFSNIASDCDLGPYVEPYPLWLDFANKELWDELQEVFPLHWFRGFKLHQVLIIPPENPQGGVAPFVYMPHCEGHEPFLSPSVPDTPLTGYEDRGTWNLTLASPSKEHWALLEDEAYQQHILMLEAQHIEEAQRLEEESLGWKTPATKKKTPSKPATKPPASGTTKHPPTVKRSKSALKKLMEEGKVDEPTGDEDLLLTAMSSELLDKPASDKICEEVSDLFEWIRSFQLQALYEMGSVWMIDRTLAEGFSAEFICISGLVSEDLSLSLCSHQERILGASAELETGPPNPEYSCTEYSCTGCLLL